MERAIRRWFDYFSLKVAILLLTYSIPTESICTNPVLFITSLTKTSVDYGNYRNVFSTCYCRYIFRYGFIEQLYRS
ncbi:hypothetical protein [Xanthocytophaga flava]|uniref:hypothetical protein n=1 Tax=Xanthocytophaga flava TaxID=3048013 RepID=UPI0028D8917E|nr:hypothetical protein [Xanthocytophaga flavus]